MSKIINSYTTGALGALVGAGLLASAYSNPQTTEGEAIAYIATCIVLTAISTLNGYVFGKDKQNTENRTEKPGIEDLTN